ncbi:hypothetical protein ON010_g9196 [Phytophthora cinnamomi]|nr:hypothetical protein ON010_g9196 [Phytophthora cinnamomi]
MAARGMRTLRVAASGSCKCPSSLGACGGELEVTWSETFNTPKVAAGLRRGEGHDLRSVFVDAHNVERGNEFILFEWEASRLETNGVNLACGAVDALEQRVERVAPALGVQRQRVLLAPEEFAWAPRLAAIAGNAAQLGVVPVRQGANPVAQVVEAHATADLRPRNVSNLVPRRHDTSITFCRATPAA